MHGEHPAVYSKQVGKDVCAVLSRNAQVDTFRAVTLRLLKRFGIEDGLDLRVKRRGAAPNGGGEVVFACPAVRQLTPVQLTDEGKFRRIRGLAFTTKVCLRNWALAAVG